MSFTVVCDSNYLGLRNSLQWLIKLGCYTSCFIFSCTIILLYQTNLQLLNKVSSLVHSNYFSSQTWLFCIICRRFQKDPSKTEVSNRFLNVIYRLGTPNILCLHFTKLQFAISKKTKS